MTLKLVPAQPEHLPVVLGFVRELAAYEKAEDRVTSSVADIRDAIFAANPRIYADLAYMSEELTGLVVTYETYSTFSGKARLYIEDLFVRADWRGRGIGRQIIAALARRCIDRGYEGLHWSVLAWNRPSIAFYRKIGADVSDSRLGCALGGAALETLANDVEPWRIAA